MWVTLKGSAAGSYQCVYIKNNLKTRNHTFEKDWSEEKLMKFSKVKKFGGLASFLSFLSFFFFVVVAFLFVRGCFVLLFVF